MAIEREEIKAALRTSGGDVRRAARALGVSLRTLQYRMREYGMPRGKRGPKRRKLTRRRKIGLLFGLGTAAATIVGAMWLSKRGKKA